ncbi:MAG: LPS export ABC transporter periplasmic protein LptC [Candidatus Omnitrophica bacterium]|nr:LPS export ABC transporter periplasmic protein LptC [Candidatus Omnitrophota bacterium]
MCKAIVLTILLILNVCPFSLAQEGIEPNQEVGGFSLVQYEDGGEKKWELNGASAEVVDDRIKFDEISAIAFSGDKAFKLKARFGDFNRKDNIVHLEDDVVLKSTDGATLKTDSLDWNAEAKNVFTDSYVNINRADFQADGKGAFCDLRHRTAMLKKDVVANIGSAETDTLGYRVSSYAKASEDRQDTIITCDGPLELNYKKNKATFLNNVRVENIRTDILADRIDVYFRPTTRRVKCVVARGNVRILNNESVTYSDKAIYLVDEDRVILPKNPKLIIQ